MVAFRFPLQKALDWRRTQLELAGAHLQQQFALIADLDRTRADLEAMGKTTEVEVRGYQPLEGADLGALGSFRLLLRDHQRQIAMRRQEFQRELAVRQAALLEARRRCQLLERLKERRLAEWREAAERELEELASDSYLAQFTRREQAKASAAYNEIHDS